MPKKTLILGASGFIGRHLFNFLKQEKYEVFGTSFSQKSDNYISCNLSEKQQVKALLADIQPDIVIFLVASKDVVGCQSDPNHAIESNVFTVKNYLGACSELDIDPVALYLSTDYVFSGENGYYLDSCPVSPSTVYGMTKAISERLFLNFSNNSFILRVSAVMSPTSGFYAMVKNALDAEKNIEMFANVVFSPTSIINLSNYILYLIETPRSNRIIHFSDGYRMSRYDLALSIAESIGADTRLIKSVNVNFSESLFQKDLSLIPTASNGFKQGSYVCYFKEFIK